MRQPERPGTDRAGKARWVAGALGGAVVLLAVFLDPLTGARPSFGRAQLLLLLVGMVVTALAVAGRRTPAMYRSAALLLLNTLVALAGAEMAAFLILLFANRGERPKPPLMSTAAYYAAVPWGARYWEDFGRANRERYEPYLLWRRQAYAGSLVTVAADGLRQTPGATCEKGAFTVFILGGSVVWGVGSPDSLTIPALVLRALSPRHRGAVCVRNLGEMGYVSTQEVIALIRELQHGRIPHLAIFVDGANDPYAAYQFGQSGVHFDYEKIKARVEGREAALGAVVWVRASNLYKLAARLAQQRIDTAHTGPNAARESLQAVAEEALRLHLANRTIVSALARQYGFAAHFFWQPSISASDKKLSADEQRIASAVSPEYVELYRRTHELAKRTAAASANFHYLGDVFDGVTETIYIDPVHITPEGNTVIAKRIVAVLDSSAARTRQAAGPR